MKETTKIPQNTMIS